MYVCHCRAVTDCRIREVIAAGATDLGEVARRSGAGVTCGGCLPGVRRLLQEREVVASAGKPEVAPSRTLPAGSVLGPRVAVAGSARA
jgi:bacterioferritin-associated ferredoxin